MKRNERRSPTLHDVAAAAGVSIKTVSRVINNSPEVFPDTRDRVARAIACLEYRPNELARSLRARSSKTVGVVIADVTNPFYGILARAIEDVAQTQGYLVMIGNCDEQIDKEREYVYALLQRQVDGLILVPALGEHSYLAALQLGSTVVVLVDRPLPDLPFDTVTINNVEGARQAVAHLLRLGHRRIGLVAGLAGLYTTEERRRGYERALHQAGLEADAGLIRLGCKTTEEALAATTDLMQIPYPPTALFGTNNLIMFGMLSALNQRRLQVPDEVAVAGFDNVDPTGIMHPRLTVVEQPNYEMGRLAAALLFERLAAAEPLPARHIVLQPRLLIQGSYGLQVEMENALEVEAV